MEKINTYGNCHECNVPLEPVWFTEEEYKITSDGYMYKTGRKRMAVSHLTCPCCMNNECVDDTFDKPWN